MQPLARLTQNRLAWRLFLIALFVIPMLLVLPHLRSLVIRNAVITARVSEVRAPISGQVVALDTVRGATAASSDPVLIIVNDRVDRSHVAKLEVIQSLAGQQLAAMRDALAALRRNAGQRNAELTGYTHSVALELEQRRLILADRAQALLAAVEQTRSSLERARTLHENDNFSDADLQAAESRYLEANAQLTQNRQDQDRLEQQVAEIRQGIFQVSVPDGPLLTRNMVQALDVEIARSELQLRELESRVQANQAELDAARALLQQNAKAEVALPPGATVWDINVSVGNYVSAGTPLLSWVDCGNLLVDIAVDDATLELMSDGQQVRVRPYGTFDFLHGPISLSRGSSSLGSVDHLAAAVQHRGPREGRVIADLGETRLSDESHQACGIGRTAYAEFEGISFLETVFFPLFR